MFLTQPTLDIPRRIVSLVPSQTELLFSLGLEEETIAITKFCVHPARWHHTKTKIGGTKQLHLDEIKALKPDLIIANKEENVKEQVEELAALFPVWVTDVNCFDDAIAMITDIGKLTGKMESATELVNAINTAFDMPYIEKKPAAYLIWKDPFMTVGGGTFISDMMQRCGFNNVFSEFKRYPEVTAADIRNSDCRIIILSSEPYPFRQEHIVLLQPLFPGITLLPVDGEIFSWYGSRMLYAPAYFTELAKMSSILK